MSLCHWLWCCVIDAWRNRCEFVYQNAAGMNDFENEIGAKVWQEENTFIEKLNFDFRVITEK